MNARRRFRDGWLPRAGRVSKHALGEAQATRMVVAGERLMKLSVADIVTKVLASLSLQTCVAPESVIWLAAVVTVLSHRERYLHVHLRLPRGRARPDHPPTGLFP